VKRLYPDSFMGAKFARNPVATRAGFYEILILSVTT